MLHLMNCLYLLMVHFILENWYLTQATYDRQFPGLWKEARPSEMQFQLHDSPRPHASWPCPLLPYHMPTFPHRTTCLAQASTPTTSPLLIAYPSPFASKQHSRPWLFCSGEFLVAWAIVPLSESFLHPLRHSRARQCRKPHL